MAEVKLRCLVCGSTELESTADGYKCDRCGSVINYTSSYMNHLALFDKVANYVDKGDTIRANQVIEELFKCSRTCPETYWYQLLSDYGIRYIGDMCYVTNDIGEPITTNENYKNALKFSGYYMEKFFKQKAKFFEDIRVGAGQEPIVNIVAADKINVTLTDSLFNEIDIEQSRTIKSSSSDNANEIKSDSKKGITLDTSDYVHKGHHHCEADDNFEISELDKDDLNNMFDEDEFDYDEDYDDEQDDIIDSDNVVADIPIKEISPGRKVISGLLVLVCAILFIVNIVILISTHKLADSIAFLGILLSVATTAIVGGLNRTSKLKFVPIFIAVAHFILIIIASVTGML